MNTNFSGPVVNRCRYTVAAMVSLSLSLLASPLSADPRMASEMLAVRPHPSASVLVRTIEAQGAPDDGSSLNIDERLSDIREKLIKLQFKNFRLVSSQTVIVPLMKKGKLALVNGFNLAVRPLYVSADRISMWLSWRDPRGMEIIDTRMHFDPGESMLTGSEQGEHEGVILAIEVKPVQ